MQLIHSVSMGRIDSFSEFDYKLVMRAREINIEATYHLMHSFFVSFRDRWYSVSAS